MAENDRYWEAKKITLIGGLCNGLLGISKLIGGYVFHSHALIADGVHSFADLITDAMVLVASKYGSLEADESHPYGHQRIETAATLFLSLLLIAAGFGIAWDALSELYHNQHQRPMTIALLIALASILANEILFWGTKKVGIRIQSQLIIANAWHHRADSAASAVVVVGLLGSLFGFLYSDALAAILVSLLVIKMGVEYIWQSLLELVDSAVDEETRQEIITMITQVDGVVKIHQLRSRRMGGDIYIDVHILVDPYCSVSEGHYIAQQVHRDLMNHLPAVRDVTVHVDSEDDEVNAPSYPLPSRAVLQKALFEKWQNQYQGIETIKLHYLHGQINIELYYSGEEKSLTMLKSRVEEDKKIFPEVKKVEILLRVS